MKLLCRKSFFLFFVIPSNNFKFKCNSYNSGSQPGCRGTLGCRKEVSGVPPNFKLLPFYWCFTTYRAAKLSFITFLGCRQFFLKIWRVPRTKKGWKTLSYNIASTSSNKNIFTNVSENSVNIKQFKTKFKVNFYRWYKYFFIILASTKQNKILIRYFFVLVLN